MIILFAAILFYRYYKISGLTAYDVPNLSSEEYSKMLSNNQKCIWLAGSAVIVWGVILALAPQIPPGISEATLKVPSLLLIITSAVFNHFSESLRKAGAPASMPK